MRRARFSIKLEMERSNPDLLKAFATVLKRRRKEAGLSQEELAFRCDLSMSYISLLETMNRQPTLTVMFNICGQLDVPMSIMLLDIEKEIGLGHRRAH